MDKPDWWPECPYPEDVFPTKRERYPKIVPDPVIRTALSGMLGREFWNIASEAIWQRWCEAALLPGWIPIDERLPEENDYYLVAWDFEGRPHSGEAWFDETGWTYPDYGGDKKSALTEPPLVTHWMPLPEPPCAVAQLGREGIARSEWPEGLRVREFPA